MTDLSLFSSVRKNFDIINLHHQSFYTTLIQITSLQFMWQITLSQVYFSSSDKTRPAVCCSVTDVNIFYTFGIRGLAEINNLHKILANIATKEHFPNTLTNYQQADRVVSSYPDSQSSHHY